MNRWIHYSLVAAVCSLIATGSAMATEDNFSLKMSNAVNPDRFFVRAGVIGVKIKTKSGETYDVTGPVLTTAQLAELADSGNDVLARYIADKVTINGETIPFSVDGTFADGSTNRSAQYRVGGPNQRQILKNSQTGIPNIVKVLEDNDIEALGTPKGITAVAQENVGTAGLSLGYFLDDEYKWLVEAFVLAAPVSTYVVAKGPTTTLDGELKVFGLQDKKIISSKLLPPTVMLGRYFGAKDAKFRPYLGGVAMYALFYDTKATEDLNKYVGGSNPGDTTVSLKNTFGVGPMVGVKYQFNDDWHLSLNLGSVRLKTEGTIVTRNTVITDETGAIYDLGAVSTAIKSGEANFGNVTSSAGSGASNVLPVTRQTGGVTGLVSKAIAYAKGQENLGTFVRKADSTLTSTIFMLSVGRSF